MDPKLIRKLVVSISGVVVAIALVVGLYLLYLKPYVTKWREARHELTTRERRLEELRKAFGNQENPQAELRALQQEIESLKKANEALEKVKTPGKENSDFPKELDDPEPEIRVELFREYMKPVMDVTKDKIKEKLRNAQISPPEINLYADLRNADEAAYYTNRATGLQGLVDIMTEARRPDGAFVFDNVKLLDYTAGKSHREGAVNLLQYEIELTLDTKSLVSFLYELQDSDQFYYITDMKIEPRTVRRSAEQQLKVSATINTTMVFESKVAEQVKAAAAKVAAPQKKGTTGGGWMAMVASAMSESMEQEKDKPEKKWYEFWKWFRD